MSILGNPYVRIGLGAAIAQYATPKVLGWLGLQGKALLDEKEERMHAIQSAGVSASVVAFTFVALGMATGQTAAQSAAVAGKGGQP